MANYRMLPPPASPGAQQKVFNGRAYTQAPGGFVDVNDADMVVLRANGWVMIGQVGTTAQRPAAGLAAGVPAYIDTSVGAPVFHDGNTWRNYLGVTV